LIQEQGHAQSVEDRKAAREAKVKKPINLYGKSESDIVWIEKRVEGLGRRMTRELR
jgi:hypothetical protein